MPLVALLGISDEGFGFQQSTLSGVSLPMDFIGWSSISAVDVFKRDLFTYDLICMQIVSVDRETIEVDEDDPSWNTLLAALVKNVSTFPDFDLWFAEVAHPAFKTNLRRIYEKPPA